ncbi:hypothetical protein RRU94_12095 [Domibacillus sp. DTU_2020_1001157_1_SI_ALB_TIR_016]|uniref:hypothetical protein n=1 Tax=Domibacillus sp. DTU_2020_1001157_1_SI_ALB_TIR_016 TaxID=3077789 RepID=UPI0028F039B8|nr:hypothetical protein [Domibacillus sp. DTU_2020_1001157_1_SI_ALB_TIR_016]WNS81531.1 hypothetical protein RRU94_12095 [Domibacillus sp. DTU_2020_1001157_1_SI_ALB_TIR_016]
MRKKIAGLMAAGMIVLIVGCSEESDLTRIDVERFEENQLVGGTETIVKKEEVKALEKVFKQVKWEPGTQVSMATMEDVKVILFFEEEAGMPERLQTYRIWLHEKGTAEILGEQEDEGYGTMSKESVNELKKVIQ